MLFVECGTGEVRLLVGVIYRSPNSPPDNNANLSSLIRGLDDIRKAHPRILLVGDFNYPEIDWNRGTCGKAITHPARDFLSATQDAFLSQLQLEPTRIRDGQTSNCLDLVLTSTDNIVSEINILPGVGRSDHVTLLLKLLISNTNTPTPPARFTYEKGDYAAMRLLLAAVDWDEELSGLNTETAWKRFKHIVKEAEERCIPQRRSTGKHKGRAWMDAETLECVRKKHRLFREWQQTRHGHDEQKKAKTKALYIKAKDQASGACRKAARQIEREVAANAKHNPKVFWSYVRSKTSKRTGIAELERTDGSKATTDTEKAETLNKFFQSVYTTESLHNMPPAPVYDVRQHLQTVTISEERVTELLANLHPNKAPGPDGIHSRILKELAEEITKPICKIFDMSLNEGTLPAEWRTATVTPIFKKGRKQDPGNYRPVSLTCVLCNVMEKLVRQSVVEHLEQNKLISDEKHGFVRGRSCITQLLDVLDDWTTALEEGYSIDAIYMDFRKAFDSVPHCRLMSKLEALGIRGQVLQWIRAFLRGRSQRVLVTETRHHRHLLLAVSRKRTYLGRHSSSCTSTIFHGL